MSLQQAATPFLPAPIIGAVTGALHSCCMDEQQQADRQRAEVEALLQRKSLTVNSASDRWGLDRNTLAKFAKGRKVSIGWIERFAAAAGVDIATWREIAGYGGVTSDVQLREALNAVDQLISGVKALQDANPHLYIPLPSRKGGFAELTLQDVEEDLRDYREGIAEGRFKPRPAEKG